MPAPPTTSIKLDTELKDRVRRLADAQRRTSHWVMREAIAQYVEREERKQAFEAEALESLRAYRENGLHLNKAELLDWLDKWGTDEDRTAPECHD